MEERFQRSHPVARVAAVAVTGVSLSLLPFATVAAYNTHGSGDHHPTRWVAGAVLLLLVIIAGAATVVWTEWERRRDPGEVADSIAQGTIVALFGALVALVVALAAVIALLVLFTLLAAVPFPERSISTLIPSGFGPQSGTIVTRTYPALWVKWLFVFFAVAGAALTFGAVWLAARLLAGRYGRSWVAAVALISVPTLVLVWFLYVASAEVYRCHAAHNSHHEADFFPGTDGVGWPGPIGSEACYGS